MPKLKLSGRKLCTTGRKLAVCGCGDPCCSVTGAWGYIPGSGTTKTVMVAVTLNAAQTTSGEYRFFTPDGGAASLQTAPSVTMGVQWAASINQTFTNVTGTGCRLRPEAFNGIQKGVDASGLPSTYAWRPSNEVFGQLSSTPAADSFSVTGDSPEFIGRSFATANVKFGVADVGALSPDPTGMQILTTVGSYSFSQTLWEVRFQVYPYIQRTGFYVSGVGSYDASSGAYPWNEIVIRVTRTGAYRVWVRIPPSGFSWTYAGSTITATPTFQGSAIVALRIEASLVASRPSFIVGGGSGPTAPPQTDTLNFTYIATTNFQGCTSAPALTSLDDALFT